MEVVPVAHIPGYIACKSVKPLMTPSEQRPRPSAEGEAQVAYLCHVCTILALNSELFYEPVNVLMNGRFLLLQGTTIESGSKHLADDSVCFGIWVSGNASVLSLNTLDLLSLDEG